MLQLNCPHCQAILSVHPSRAGEISECTICQGKFLVPVPMAKTPVSSSLDSSNQGRMDPEYGEFVDKKLAAGICGILLGGFGVHKFLLGLNNAGLIMLAVSLSGLVVGPCLILPLFGPVIMGVVGLIEGIIYLTKAQDDFYQTYAVEKKDWF